MLPRARLDAFTTAGREAMAFARQAVLLRHDTTAPVLPTGVTAGDDVVVFLHGLFASAGVLRPLRAHVTRHARVHAAALSYFPGPGIEEIARRLDGVLTALPEGVRLHLVGHSLGGIVARHHAQRARDARIVQTISMASPFAGVPSASLFGFDAARDLAPGSAILRKVVLESATSPVPHLSIIAGADSLVKSPVSHALPGSDVVVLSGRGHNTLLFDDEAARLVEKRVIEKRASAR